MEVIFWKKKPIYYFKGGVFESLYKNLFIIYASDEFDLSDDLIALIRQLFDPGGIDLSSYIHSRKDLLMFIKMVRKGLDQHYEEHLTCPNTAKEHLENFYKNLVEIAKTYPN